MTARIGDDSARIVPSYEDTLRALNGLQSNAAYLQSVKNRPCKSDGQKLLDTEKYLLRAGTTLEDLDRLSVIHVAGTKGKGSTCAFTESILRNHGFHTGFFSSPHLVSVRERIRLNGQAISEAKFTHYFWRVYNRLKKEAEHETDMPTYFKFLTVMMFHVFLEANVDVAIIEVGIGGLNDCTNIVRKPVCVGITSLGLDHTGLLGNTIEEIAYQKSGIFKPKTVAFTVPQVPEALRVLEERAIERKCTLNMIPRFQEYHWENVSPVASIPNHLQQQNASLATQLASEWLRRTSGCNSYVIQSPPKSERVLRDSLTNKLNKLPPGKLDLSNAVSMDKIALGLKSCKLSGRMQILRSSFADFYLDGAHTAESVANCIAWFAGACPDEGRRMLIFNVMGDRNPIRFMSELRALNFERAYFVQNYAGIETVDAVANYTKPQHSVAQCQKNADWWGEGSVVLESLNDVFHHIVKNAAASGEKPQVLVTGSLRLVGAVLAILDPNLTMRTDL